MPCPSLAPAVLTLRDWRGTLRDNPGDVDLIIGPALEAFAVSERVRRQADQPLKARILVVIDQMEQLFTHDAAR